jgi:iron-sulfur cluster assembly accessory protein
MLPNKAEPIMIAHHSIRLLLVASVAVLGFGCNINSIPESAGTDSSAPPAVGKSESKVDDQPYITVTPSAARVITQLIGDMNKESPTGSIYLRLRALPGGCTGLMQKLDLDPVASTSTDYVSESSGIKVVVWKSQVDMMRGAIIDYGKKDSQTGFMIKNANFEGEAARKWMSMLEESVPESERPKRPLLAPIAERIAQCRKMTTDDPDNELAYYQLGQLLMEDGKSAEAVESFERTLQLSPDFSKAYQLLGKCLIKLDRKDRAVEVLTKGWTNADQEGDKTERDAIEKLLADLGKPSPKKTNRTP